MTTLGAISLWLAFLLSLWGVVVGWLALRLDRGTLRESARRATVALAALLALAIISLLVALLRRDFNVAYVAAHVTRNLSAPYVAAAINAGWVGKLLVGSFFFSLLSTLRRVPPAGQVTAAAGLSLAATTTLLAGRPFHRLGITPFEGHGLDPALLHAGLVAGSTLVLLGDAALGAALMRLAGFVVHRRAPVPALRESGQWTLAAWVLLGAGATAGLWWAYGYASPGGWRSLDPTGSAAPVTLAVATAGLLVLRPSGGLGVRVAAAGVCLLVLAGVGSRLAVEQEIRLKPGEAASINSRLGPVYTLVHTGVSRFEAADHFVTAATLEVRRGETPIGLVVSERRQHVDALGRPLRGPITRVGVRRGLIEDLRVVLLDRVAGTEDAVYRVRVNPLMSCAWLGAGLLIAGGLLALVAGA